MEKNDLRRKVIATVLTTIVLCAALGVAVWLLLTSGVFTGTVKWLMLGCCALLAICLLYTSRGVLCEEIRFEQHTRRRAQRLRALPRAEDLLHRALQSGAVVIGNAAADDHTPHSSSRNWRMRRIASVRCLMEYE